MKKKITKLTKEQAKRLIEFRDKWIQIGLSTEPAKREKAEAAIREMYRIAGGAPPQKIVWCGSPLASRSGLTANCCTSPASGACSRQMSTTTSL